jgi:hypothetical protein
VVRNGNHQPRDVLTSAGSVEVIAPRVNDKRVDADTGERRRFSSAILPAWARKTPKITEVLPLLYLHGLCAPWSTTSAAAAGLREAFVDAHHLRDGGETPQLDEWHRMTDDAAVPLLRDAQAAGTAHPDLRADELMAIVAAVAHAGGGDLAGAHRLLTFVTEGITRSP